MENLFNNINSTIALTAADQALLEKVFVAMKTPAKSILIQAGYTEHYLYFLASGIVKGYQNKEGKIVVEHLVEKGNFFTSLDSFIAESPSVDYFETVTDCILYKITKSDFNVLRSSSQKWTTYIDGLMNDSLKCKMERVKDFQVLTAKERYLKLLHNSPELALKVSIESLASFIGIEPQSLSRIRKQITI